MFSNILKIKIRQKIWTSLTLCLASSGTQAYDVPHSGGHLRVYPRVSWPPGVTAGTARSAALTEAGGERKIVRHTHATTPRCAPLDTYQAMGIEPCFSSEWKVLFLTTQIQNPLCWNNKNVLLSPQKQALFLNDKLLCCNFLSFEYSNLSLKEASYFTFYCNLRINS